MGCGEGRDRAEVAALRRMGGEFLDKVAERTQRTGRRSGAAAGARCPTHSQISPPGPTHAGVSLMIIDNLIIVS